MVAVGERFTDGFRTYIILRLTPATVEYLDYYTEEVGVDPMTPRARIARVTSVRRMSSRLLWEQDVQTGLLRRLL